MQGVYPFFDYEFTYPSRVLHQEPQAKTYPKDSIMGFVQDHFPLFAFLVKTARLDWQLADPQFRGTLFLPHNLEKNVVLNADINTARRIVKYHLMIGFFPKDVLFTSPFQELQTSIKGQMIRAVIQGPSQLLLNSNTSVLHFDHWCQNGVIHLVDRPLFELQF